jgi:2-keto-4-pentenoate hydratase/2-oxohepta-3-ene-1,7-dioic acid hydratase in catechol pathway
MRLLTYRTGSEHRVGLLDGSGVIDLWTVAAKVQQGLPTTGAIEVLLEIPNWQQLIVQVRERSSGIQLELSSLDIGPVVYRPRNVFVVAANTISHLKEASAVTNGAAPLKPVVLAKSPGALSGPSDPIIHPNLSAKVDYEAEIGVIIGTTCRNVPEAEVNQVIAGYTVTNDVSARDYQLSEWEPNSFYRTHYLGKSFDGFCPCGPVMVTPDEVPNLESRSVRCWVNGELRQDEPVSGLYFSIPKVVSFISSVMTLYPGDMLLMGTPAGVGSFSDPTRYLAPGDVVRCEVEGIGFIENLIVGDEAAVRIDRRSALA